MVGVAQTLPNNGRGPQGREMCVCRSERLGGRSMAYSLSPEEVSKHADFRTTLFVSVLINAPHTHDYHFISNDKIKRQLLQCFLLNGVILGVRFLMCIFAITKCLDQS